MLLTCKPLLELVAGVPAYEWILGNSNAGGNPSHPVRTRKAPSHFMLYTVFSLSGGNQ